MKRLLTAMVTPFTDEGLLDKKAVIKLVEHLLDEGSEGLVLTGTTGESPTITLEERKQLWQIVQETVDGRIPIWAGTGSNCTSTSIKITEAATSSGLDGVMLVAPYYNKPSQEGLKLHFQTVAAATSLPVMIYNIPGRTAVDMDVKTLLAVAEIPNVKAIKESSNNLLKISSLIQKLPKDVNVYSGDDPLTLPMLALGAKGIVSVASHLCGLLILKMIEAVEQGDLVLARTYHYQCWPVFTHIFMQANPVPIKYALSCRGICGSHVRLPLVPLTECERKYLNEKLINFL